MEERGREQTKKRDGDREEMEEKCQKGKTEIEKKRHKPDYHSIMIIASLIV